MSKSASATSTLEEYHKLSQWYPGQSLSCQGFPLLICNHTHSRIQKEKIFWKLYLMHGCNILISKILYRYLAVNESIISRTCWARITGVPGISSISNWSWWSWWSLIIDSWYTRQSSFTSRANRAGWSYRASRTRVSKCTGNSRSSSITSISWRSWRTCNKNNNNNNNDDDDDDDDDNLIRKAPYSRNFREAVVGIVVRAVWKSIGKTLIFDPRMSVNPDAIDFQHAKTYNNRPSRDLPAKGWIIMFNDFIV